MLRDYVESGSEAAFRGLVERYIDFVYSTALRVVNGNRQLAEDISQTVFVNLARQAETLSKEVMIGGWLHQHTFHVATKAIRSDRRRLSRERKAAEMNTLNDQSSTELKQLRLILDEAITHLAIEDRTAILLRFFDQRDFHSVGQALGSTEHAARMRVNRALEKLHLLLKNRGVSLSIAALASAISAEAAIAAPTGLAATISGAALTTAAAGTALPLLKLITMTKIKIGIAGAVVVAAATASFVIQDQARARLRYQDQYLRSQSERLAAAETENKRLSSLLAGASQPGANNLDELLRLRREAAALRAQTNDLAGLRDQNSRLRWRNAPPGDNSKTAFELKEEAKEMAVSRLNFTRSWLLAFHNFAELNKGQFPTNFDQASGFLPSEILTLTNLTTDQFEIVYQGALSNVATPASTIVIREKQPFTTYIRDSGWVKAKGYAFADGHSEVHMARDGKFDDWEKQRMVQPKGQ